MVGAFERSFVFDPREHTVGKDDRAHAREGRRPILVVRVEPPDVEMAVRGGDYRIRRLAFGRAIERAGEPVAGNNFQRDVLDRIAVVRTLFRIDRLAVGLGRHGREIEFFEQAGAESRFSCFPGFFVRETGEQAL